MDNPELFLANAESRRPLLLDQSRDLESMLKTFGIPPGSRILDLCCGTGIHSTQLAKQGYEVVGLDISPHAINRAKEEAKKLALTRSNVRFYVGDARKAVSIMTKNGESEFQAILNLGTAQGYYGKRGDIKMFSAIGKLAAKNCLLVVDTVNRDWLVKHVTSHPGVEDFVEGVTLVVKRRLNLEKSMMENQQTYYKNMDSGNLKPLLTLRVTHVVYSLHEFKDLLAGAGWSYLKSSGSLNMQSPLSLDDFHMVIVSRKSRLLSHA